MRWKSLRRAVGCAGAMLLAVEVGAASAWLQPAPGDAAPMRQPPAAVVSSPIMAKLAPLAVDWRSPGFVNAVWDLRGDASRQPAVWPVVRPSQLLVCECRHSVSAQVKQDFGTLLVLNQPEHRDSLQQAFALDWLKAYREALGEPYALHPGNLADSVTAYLVSLWAMVNEQPAVPVNVVRALRDRMRDAMVAQQALALLPCEARQRVNETLIYNTVLLVAQRHGLLQRQDAQGMRDAVAHYHQVAQDTLQVDLRRVRLDALVQAQ